MINIKIFKSSIANILKDYYQLFHLVIIKPKKIEFLIYQYIWCASQSPRAALAQ